MTETPQATPLLNQLLRLFEPKDQAERERARPIVMKLLDAQGRGDTAIKVDEKDQSWLKKRPWVGDGSQPTPVVLLGDLLQFQIYWQAERHILNGLQPLVQQRHHNASLAEDFLQHAKLHHLDAEKLTQIKRALAQPLTLLTGGPGTGKTTTLAWLLAALLRQQPDLTIALAAPTGKAAARMKTALDKAIPSLPLPPEQKQRLQALAPSTLHRLLGMGNTPHPRHHKDNPLDQDLIVVDEASMVDVLTLSKLIQAITPQSRLILMGDPNQLASVEAGSVLADLTQCFPQVHCQLTRSHRFERSIGELAAAVLTGEHAAAWACLQAPDQSVLQTLPLQAQPVLNAAMRAYAPYLDLLKQFHPGRYHEVAEQAKRLLDALEQFRVLTPLRYHKKWGTIVLNHHLIQQFGLKPLAHDLYLGQPILIQENDYQLGLFNGDQGIILPLDGAPVAWFATGETMRAVAVSQLPRWETALAMTVHKAQGAEFDQVLFLLPDEETPITTRELVYTALTRAKKAFIFAGTDQALSDAIKRKTNRVSGLKCD
ncbi:MAG TPA: exodeoxyribonuclease V subunit alpha [Sulfurivirga caldicuralii]|nr:exodeoxyribonuclease V subunit alpha [Sulfurivirga caldicuralii]